MKNLHIIVQAGGRGSRLRHHTWNKPKCLVSVKGKPLLYHLFDRFPDATFHVIGDYAFDKLKTYLEINPPGVKFDLIETKEKGTCSGISTAMTSVPADANLLILWSDLIVNSIPTFIDSDKPVVFFTNSFVCRWTLNDQGELKEQPGKNGIPGIFYVNRAKDFPTPPIQGEFVKWFSHNVLDFDTAEFNDIEELGDFASIEHENDRAGFSRFFNEVIIKEEVVLKRAIDSNYAHLIEKEQHWYRSVQDLGFRRTPKVISTEPYTLERIMGNHAYQMTDLSEREKRAVLADYLDSLTTLHDLGKRESVDADVRETYIEKTIRRVSEVADIIPHFRHKSLTINGLKCRNIFCYPDEFEKIFSLLNPKFFTPIHGDPTFSNSIVDRNLRTWFIDPRGYFAKPGVWGDPVYDFAKVYYSAIGGYDSFNRRKFKLYIDDETVEVIVEEPIFSKAGKEVFADFFNNDLHKIEILHGLIWLALSGYAKDDIDSILGSFYYGLYWLEQGLNKA